MKVDKIKIKLHFQKWWHLYILALIVLVAFFIRTYHFSDWLYLKSDQVRDMNRVKSIYDGGLSQMPLLGPKASGSNLFLGPIFYYFQYASAFLFQSIEPHVLVFPDLFFSLLTIPLLFYFLRQFFSKKVALLTVAVFASSYIFTQYARFGWNPNSIPFWGLLTMLGIFKTGVEKDRKKAGKWLIIAAAAFGVVSQLHFIAFVGYPIVVFLFWIFYRPKNIHWKFWVIAVGIFLFLNLPLIVNDTIGGGNNWEHFVYTLSNKEEPRGARESAIRAVTYQGRFLMTFVTSINNNEIKKVDLIGFYFCIISLGLGAFLWKKKNVSWFGKISKEKRVFLVFILTIFLGFAPLYWKLAYDVNNSRYWFTIFVVPFVFLAFYLQIFFQIGKQKDWRRYFKIIPYVVAISLIILNFTAIGKWYGSLAAQKEVDFLGRQWTSKTLRQKDLETVFVQKKVAKYMVEEANKSGKDVCFKSPSVHASVYEFFIENDFKGKVVFEGDIERASFEKLGDKCKFFLIDKSEKKTKQALDKVGDDLELKSKKSFGAVAVWNVNFNGKRIIKEEQEVIEKLQAHGDIKRSEASEIEAEQEESREEDQIPECREKKNWGDLWKKVQ